MLSLVLAGAAWVCRLRRDKVTINIRSAWADGFRPENIPGIRHETSDHSRWRSRHTFAAIPVSLPKPLMPIVEHPILEIIIDS
jgi:hypothetical protein